MAVKKNQDRIKLGQELGKSGLIVRLDSFLSKVIIDSRPEPALYFNKAEAWQRDLDHFLGPALEKAIGVNKEYNGPNRFMIVMPRGHDKTSKLGRLANYALTFAKFPITIAAGAVDSHQASLLTEAMETEARLNEWYGKYLEFQKEKVLGATGRLDILTSDAPSAYGRRDDITIIDELTHWKKRDLWDSLFSGAEKRNTGVFIIITNAGIKGTWQHDVFKVANESPYWKVYSTPIGHRTGWMDASQIDFTRSLLNKGMADRVIDNKWIDADTETIFLTGPEVDQCSNVGKELGLERRERADRSLGRRYIVTIDYAPKKDRTVLTVMHKEVLEGASFILVDEMDVWQGSDTRPTSIRQLEEWISERNQRYYYPDIVADPYQMEATCQKFSSTNEVFRFESRGGKRNYEMAENLRHLILNGRLAWYPRCGEIVDRKGNLDTLEQELKDLVLKPNMNYGYRFDHIASKHDDRAVAIGMGALYLAKLMDNDWIGPIPLRQHSPPEEMQEVFEQNRWSRTNKVYGVEYEQRSHPIFGKAGSIQVPSSANRHRFLIRG